MNISNNNNVKPVVIDFQGYVNRKLGSKQSCHGCFYVFTSKNKKVRFCDQCSDGRRVYRNLKATQSMLAARGVYGYH